MKRFLFLDIDGVMAIEFKDRFEDGYCSFTQKSVEVLNLLVEKIPDIQIIKEKYLLREYKYNRKIREIIEYTWHIHHIIKNKIEQECGLGTHNKKFPSWIYALSKRQANILLDALYAGDGTKRKNCFIYYNTNKNVSDGVHAIALLAEKNSNLRKPYDFSSPFGSGIIYQTYWSNKENSPKAMLFNTDCKKNKKRLLVGGSKINYSGKVVCFTVPNSTLITRLDGKIAITGNSKFAYHIIRLMHEGYELLTKGKLEYPLKGKVLEDIYKIRNNEVEYANLLTMIDQYEEICNEAYEKSIIQYSPDWEHCNNWLIKTLKNEMIEG